MKRILLLLLLFNCSFDTIQRQYGLHEYVRYPERRIISTDTVWNEHGGVIKIVTIRAKRGDKK